MALRKKIFLAVALAALPMLGASPAWGAEASPAPAAVADPVKATMTLEVVAKNVDLFGRMAVLEGGRVKPLDTVARAALMRFGGRAEATNPDGKRVAARAWLWQIAAGDKSVEEWEVFRIDHPELKSLIGMADKFTSYAKLAAAFPELLRSAEAAPPEEKAWGPYEKALQRLLQNMGYYRQLRKGLQSGSLFAQTPELAPVMLARVAYEFFFNEARPLLWAEVFYVLAFVMVLLSGWSPKATRMGRAAGWLLAVGFALHLWGLGSRMWIQERPPVTNLYSSAVFIGVGAVVAAGLIERALRNGLGLALGSLLGFATLQIADKLAESGDTLEMMRAVLDSNFWLSTHVVVVTLGYSAMFIAGGAAAIAILRELGRRMSPEELRRTAGVVYGTLCAGLLLSFVGTMLGGVWADQSWGRFWGWDPKENGALMIVLYAALVLHARWGGMVRERGVLLLAIGGNIVTAWSWFGTNLLGVGLHSYGFTDKGLWMLCAFVFSQLALIFLGVAMGMGSERKRA